MKKLYSIISLVLVAVMFVGCTAKTPTDTLPEEPVHTVNGVNIKDYTIIYDDADMYSKFAAENFADYLTVKYNITLKVQDDNAAEQPNEFLVGNGVRNIALPTDLSLNENNYYLKGDSTKISMWANGYMIGGAVRGFLDIFEASLNENGEYKAELVSPVTKEYEFKDAKSAILLIGDGMGFNSIEWAKKEGMPKFYAEDMPNKGEAITYSYSVKPLEKAEYTDSAAAGTALATGYKTLNSFVGVDPVTRRILKNVRELAQENGAKTAVLTTDAITGATPAAFLAHWKSRSDTAKLKEQIDKVQNEGKVTVLRGSLDVNSLQVSKDALKTISSENSNFFMVFEEGYIDKNSHSNQSTAMIKCVKRFNDVIANAMQFALVRGDTVVIVTADHETGGIEKDGNGFKYTSKDHTNKNVPLFAMGKGTEILTKKPLENTLIPKFIAKCYSEEEFGNPEFKFPE